MRGIILAGGQGTRLAPLTKLTNKHLLPVYDRPMIEYPLYTLIEMGCDEILIVTGGEHIGDFARYLRDGSQYGVRLTYRVQPEAGGVAQALACAEGFIKQEQCFPVILGDNFFGKPPAMPNKPTIYTKAVPDANRFGVYSVDTMSIVEKPDVAQGRAVTGLYVYDFKVFNQLRYLQPSERGELEITDINNWYLSSVDLDVVELDTYWRDMGTHDTLLEVANYVKDSSI